MAQKIGSWLKDEECVQLALACATRCPKEVVEFMFSLNVARVAAEVGYSVIRITKDEWKQLFGLRHNRRRVGQLAVVMRDAKFTAASRELGDALRRTIEEPAQKCVDKPWSKLILYSGQLT